MRPNPQETADLVTFTEEIRNRKLRFFVFCGPSSSGLDNYFACKRFPVQNLQWSMGFVIQINPDYDTITLVQLK